MYTVNGNLDSANPITRHNKAPERFTYFFFVVLGFFFVFISLFCHWVDRVFPKREKEQLKVEESRMKSPSREKRASALEITHTSSTGLGKLLLFWPIPDTLVISFGISWGLFKEKQFLDSHN